MFKKLIMTAVLGSIASAALALETGDVIRLARAKAGDEVIIAQIKATESRFTLTADEIIRLKKEGVSDAVLKAMIETAKRPKNTAEAGAKTKAGEKDAKRTDQPVGEGLGTLILENLDSKAYSVQVDAERGNIFYYKGVATDGRDLLPAKSSLVYRLSAGRYGLRWVGKKDTQTLKVMAGKTSRAVLTRTSTEDFEAAYLSLFEDGHRRGGGRLVKLVDRSPAESVQASAPPRTGVVEKHYYYPAQTYAVRQPVTYYRPSSYYRSSYHGGRYYRRSSSWLVPGFAYTWRRGKSRYAVGWGSGGGLGFSYGRRLGRSGYRINFGW